MCRPFYAELQIKSVCVFSIFAKFNFQKFLVPRKKQDVACVLVYFSEFSKSQCREIQCFGDSMFDCVFGGGGGNRGVTNEARCAKPIYVTPVLCILPKKK